MRRAAAALAAFMSLSAPATAAPQGFLLHAAPLDLPGIAFEDAEGRPVTLADFAGRTVLLNVWATWCPPCVKEMPTLDALEASLGGDAFEVVALSIDSAGPEAVRDFFARTGVENLALYIDRSSRVTASLGAFGLPTTLLIDPRGREAGRLVGPAEWDAPDMVAFLRKFLADGGSSAAAGAPAPVPWRVRRPPGAVEK